MQPCESDVADGTLLLAYRRGQLDAFTALYDRYEDRLFFYARTLTGDADAAQDIVQEAFVRLLRVEPDGPEKPLGPLLFITVRNLSADSRRRAAVRERTHAAQEPRPVEEASHVGELLDTLPAEHREVVFLRIYSDLTFAEIGQVTGHKLQTVASRYRAALEKLAPLLAEGISR